MKLNNIIVCSIISIALTSCLFEKYRIITRVDRNGSFLREIHTIADTISDNFPYDLSAGWEISQTDTAMTERLYEKNKKNIVISKKFNSIHESTADRRREVIFPTPEESLKKRFRWFYTYFTFTAVYPEITEKGRVPMDQFLNRDEQKFYLQGDMTAYRGMNGAELKEELDDIETRFWKWYARSVYEKYFDVILHFTDNGLRSQLIAVNDTVYSLNEKQIDEISGMNDFCTMIDKYLGIDHFSGLYAESSQEIDNMLEEKSKTIDKLISIEIQYELVLPGKIMAVNTDLQNDGVLVWDVTLFRFLADDYTLTAESRVVNIWAFVATLLLIMFSVYCFMKTFHVSLRR